MSRCFHCNDEIPERTAISKEINGQTREFCCHGCLAVSEWIYHENLEQYYAVRESAPALKDSVSKDFSGYDLPEIYDKYVRSLPSNASQQGADLKSLDLRVEGIHCAACVWLLENALKRLSGVQQVDGNASTYLLSLRWDDKQIKLSKLLSTIHNLGYKHVLNARADGRLSYQKKRNQLLKKLIVAGLGMMQVMMYSSGLYAGEFYGIVAISERLLQWVSFIITTPVYFYSGSVFLFSAVKAIRHCHINMDVPIALAITLAYVASVYHFFTHQGEIYFDTVVMFVFFLSASRYLEMMTRYKALLKSSEQGELLPEVVRLSTASSQTQLLPLDALRVDDEVIVDVGEVIPADGIVIAGESAVSEAHLTGESKPIKKQQSAAVYAGSVNGKAPLTIKVTAVKGQTALAETERLLNGASVQKSELSRLADRLASKILIFILLTALGSYAVWAWFLHSEEAFTVALSVLVATCPCALSLAVPTVYAATANRLSENRLYLKNNDLLDIIPKVKSILFDKTGTLTEPATQVSVEVVFGDYSQSTVLEIAGALERHFNHPIAAGFRQHDQQTMSASSLSAIEGKGVSGTINGKLYYLGNTQLVSSLLTDIDVEQLQADFIYLIEDNQLIAMFSLQEVLNRKAEKTIQALSDYQLCIVSGDHIERVTAVAKRLGISDYHGGLQAKDKLALLQEKQQQGLVMMVGDGINDAPVLKGADVSVAVGNASALSQMQADIVLIGENLFEVPKLICIAKQAKRIIKQNLIWAIGYNTLAIPFAMAGYLQPWVAALGMSISSLVVLCNALRIFWVDKRR